MAADGESKWKRAQPAPAFAFKVFHLAFPRARDMGIYAPREVKGTGVLSGHSEGRALDLGLSVEVPAEKALGDAIFALVVANAAHWGIDHVIWDRQIWSTAHPHVRPFRGPYRKHGREVTDDKGKVVLKNPHVDHIHIEWTREGSQMQRLRDIETQLGTLKTNLEELGIYFDSREPL